MKIKNNQRWSLRKGLFAAALVPCLLLTTPSALQAGSPVGSTTESGWTLMAEQDGVQAYAKLESCTTDQPAVYLIKLVNASEKSDLAIAYSVDVVNDPTLSAVKRSMDLKANSSMEGSCDDANEYYLRAMSFGENPSLSSLKIVLSNLKTTNDED